MSKAADKQLTDLLSETGTGPAQPFAASVRPERPACSATSAGSVRVKIFEAGCSGIH
jgi:hypothetical protein